MRSHSRELDHSSMEMAGGCKGGEYVSEEKWICMPIDANFTRHKAGYGINFPRGRPRQQYILVIVSITSPGEGCLSIDSI